MATHLKSLFEKAKLNKGHVKAARVYKARVERLKSDSKHTMSAPCSGRG